MAKVITCPHCHKRYRSSGTSLGKRIRCKRCETVFTAVEETRPAKKAPEADTGPHMAVGAEEEPGSRPGLAASGALAEGRSPADMTVEDAESLWADAASAGESIEASVKADGTTPSLQSRCFNDM